MQSAAKSNRLHIAIFGKRNTGKSSLMNALTEQAASLVSDVPGTTADPVMKSIEWPSLGPVVLIDTAGIDDEGELGELRVRKSREIIEKADLALMLFDHEGDWGLEREWTLLLTGRGIPVIGVINKLDLRGFDVQPLQQQLNIPVIEVSAVTMKNMHLLKEAIGIYAPRDFERATLLGDLIEPGDMVILVAPQNAQAPKGRLILPQVQTIRDILDHHACALAVTEEELEQTLRNLREKPKLVVTDSQVFKQVNAAVSADVPLTSFSILMARYKGDLPELVRGARAIDLLRPRDKVLIAEACTHHAMKGDIGREKLPAWLTQYVGGQLEFTVCSGSDFPAMGNLHQYKLVIHCGGCMINRKQMMSRIGQASDHGVPITNYGVAIAHMNGILERVTSMFPNL